MHRTRWMQIKEPHLANDSRADKLRVLVPFRANLEAIPTGDASGKRVARFLQPGSHFRAFAERVGAVNRDPALCALKILKHLRTIYNKISHERKFCQRFDAGQLLESTHKRGASLARLAIDQHRKSATDFLEAAGFIADGRRFAAFARAGFFGDVPQAGDDIQVRPRTCPLRGLGWRGNRRHKLCR